ncbi:conserved exported hypothetical protein [Rhizobium sp. EC-SD404]|nr:conserved exported hypothetical protein [Rhizobium sp. EC-SD404]
MMVLRYAALILAFLAIAPAAHATGTITCADQDDRVALELSIGSLPVLKVVGGSIAVDDRMIAIGGDDADAFAVGQAFRADGRLMVDFTDMNIEAVTARLRLEEAGEDRDFVTAGTFQLVGTGAYAVTCVGP